MAHLPKHVERHLLLGMGECENLIWCSGFLGAKLVTWEAEDCEPLGGVLLVELVEFLVRLARVPHAYMGGCDARRSGRARATLEMYGGLAVPAQRVAQAHL